ncbi:8-oxo-dGTP diphosphatase [Jeotgalibaca caeni]|uniref:8-oxo-dGTP diphosphatase n=1 Tax=Jeotgalibaca caeni TaxID=3028623 RepID=UPI00237DD652|nr:8-oxo-dGTP diphosphatase [Jeotgalibaca caeni]MDE1548245.1 8-oxo-dGTP diphosphatase [Jeotgalibaca caeni]
MARNELAVFTNMCMVYDDEGNVLVQERSSEDWPGITFPGGHVEKGESFVEAVKREVWEETGLTIERPVLCGMKQFQDENDARYMVFFYKTNQYHGELRSSSEGEVFWVKREELMTYPLADDFEKMLEVMETEELSEFYYYHSEEKEWELKLL